MLGAVTITDADNGTGRTIPSSSTTVWDHVWVKIAGPANLHCAELTFFGPSATSNLTVTSSALTAAAAPSSMKIVAMVKHVNSATAGTDYKFKASRDGGTNLSGYATLTDRFTIPGGSVHVIESDAIDVTGSPPAPRHAGSSRPSTTRWSSCRPSISTGPDERGEMALNGYLKDPTSRCLVPKTVIIDRLHTAGLLEAARTALDNADVYTRERWNVRDAIYSDDATAIALLVAIGADPAEILAV